MNKPVCISINEVNHYFFNNKGKKLSLNELEILLVKEKKAKEQRIKKYLKLGLTGREIYFLEQQLQIITIRR